MLDNYDPGLKQQALHDLTLRARGGMFIYLATWFITTLWADIPARFPLFFYLNTLAFVVIALFRAAQYLAHRKHPYRNVERMSCWLVSAILISALHWGAMAAWIVHDPDFAELKYVYLISMAAFAIGGTSTLSISREVRILFPLLIFSPTIAMNIYLGNTEDRILVALALISMVYVFEASRVSNRDYFKAVSNQQLANERAQLMEQLSITDPLTQLKNRMYFNMKYTQEWKRCNRLRSPLALLMLDLDHFKNLNDTYGHLFGDECLQEVARILSRELPRATDTVARYGGEEFVILLPDTDTRQAEAIAERLLGAIASAQLSADRRTVRVTCSIGLGSTVPDHDSGGKTLLMTVDEALYRAKENGRNQYCVAGDGSGPPPPQAPQTPEPATAAPEPGKQIARV